LHDLDTLCVREGVRPGPSLHDGRRVRALSGRGRPLPGSAPPLVAHRPGLCRRRGATQSVAGISPGPRCAITEQNQLGFGGEGHSRERSRPLLRDPLAGCPQTRRVRALPGLPLWLSLRGLADLYMVRRIVAVAGFRPGPRCAAVPFQLDPTVILGVAEVRLRPRCAFGRKISVSAS
jgi:hypothetical protein